MFSFNPFHALSSSSKAQAAAGDKNLTTYLDSERKLASAWLKLADDRRIAANHLKMFGRPLGDDLTDVTSKLGDLFVEWAEAMTDFAGQYDQHHATIKSIADKEASLAGSRDKRQRLQDTIRKHEENHPGQVDKLMELKEQLAELERASKPAEADASNFQRIATREAMYLLLNGMHELASKMDMIATFGKYIVDELDVTPVQPDEERPAYHGSEQTTRIVKDAKRSMADWRPDTAKLRRTLTSHHGQNPLVVERSVEEKQLPALPATNDGQKPDDATTHGSSSPLKPDEPAATTPSSSAPSSPPGSNRNSGRFSVYGPPSIGAGGFSPMLFDQQPHHMYEFYQHYTPPRPYEEMARQHRPHLSPHASPFLGPGGFVLPTANPNFVHPQPSVSTSTCASLPSAAADEQPSPTSPTKTEVSCPE